VAIGSALTPLQTYSDLLLSAILALCGLVLLGKINLDLGGMNAERFKFLADRGWAGAFLLGAGLALAFCPVSAALFFGGLLPLVLSANDWLLLPIAYGIGTAIPVLVAVPSLHAAGGVGKNVKLLSKAGGVADSVIGWLFLVGSAYYLVSFLGLI
jgi:cytochrome c biogenesis protein CcdA